MNRFDKENKVNNKKFECWLVRGIYKWKSGKSAEMSFQERDWIKCYRNLLNSEGTSWYFWRKIRKICEQSWRRNYSALMRNLWFKKPKLF